jgi:hypothetical protein
MLKAPLSFSFCAFEMIKGKRKVADAGEDVYVDYKFFQNN